MALASDSCAEVAAVLDPTGTIWKRIWCAFELFFVTAILPKACNRALNVAVINEEGVVSDGDSTTRSLLRVEEMIHGIHIAEASASQESDKLMIQRVMKEEGVEPEDLDAVLRNIITSGVDNARLRRMVPVVILT